MTTYYPRSRAVLSCLFDGEGGGEDRFERFSITPRSVEWNRNTMREADTFSLELDYRDLPLDPRAIRSLRVDIIAGDVEDPRLALSEGDGDKHRFSGLADTTETVLDSGGEVVKISGRDFTALFLDHVWDGSQVDITKPLIRVIESIVAATPGSSGIVVTSTSGASEVLSKKLGRTKWTVKPGYDTWSLIVDICGQAALLPVIDKNELRLAASDDFRAGLAMFMYGRDLERLSFRRRANETRTGQIRVRAWDDQAGSSREAIWPRSPIVRRRKISAEGKVTNEYAPIYEFSVKGAWSQEQLEARAKEIYEAGARNQIEGELVTREMQDKATAQDLLDLANGDTVTVELGKYNPGSIAGMSDGEAINRLVEGHEGLLPGVARTVVRAWRASSDLLTSFYVKTAKHRWSRADGYQLSVEFINFV